jgi:hypothetical protein
MRMKWREASKLQVNSLVRIGLWTMVVGIQSGSIIHATALMSQITFDQA